ncbi:hypothetical protein M0804_003395 [Polistes exclamans]|nr:hypothetical protein M0804_003395 [Polistes exclamans]
MRLAFYSYVDSIRGCSGNASTPLHFTTPPKFERCSAFSGKRSEILFYGAGTGTGTGASFARFTLECSKEL